MRLSSLDGMSWPSAMFSTSSASRKYQKRRLPGGRGMRGRSPAGLSGSRPPSTRHGWRSAFSSGLERLVGSATGRLIIRSST